jgi:hypothetical protein
MRRSGFVPDKFSISLRRYEPDQVRRDSLSRAILFKKVCFLKRRDTSNGSFAGAKIRKSF